MTNPNGYRIDTGAVNTAVAQMTSPHLRRSASAGFG